jgi:hypothetical protein
MRPGCHPAGSRQALRAVRSYNEFDAGRRPQTVNGLGALQTIASAQKTRFAKAHTIIHERAISGLHGLVRFPLEGNPALNQGKMILGVLETQPTL